MRVHRPSFHDVVNCLSHPLDEKRSNLSRLLRKTGSTSVSLAIILDCWRKLSNYRHTSVSWQYLKCLL